MAVEERAWGSFGLLANYSASDEEVSFTVAHKRVELSTPAGCPPRIDVTLAQGVVLTWNMRGLAAETRVAIKVKGSSTLILHHWNALGILSICSAGAGSTKFSLVWAEEESGVDFPGGEGLVAIHRPRANGCDVLKSSGTVHTTIVGDVVEVRDGHLTLDCGGTRMKSLEVNGRLTLRPQPNSNQFTAAKVKLHKGSFLNFEGLLAVNNLVGGEVVGDSDGSALKARAKSEVRSARLRIPSVHLERNALLHQCSVEIGYLNLEAASAAHISGGVEHLVCDSGRVIGLAGEALEIQEVGTAKNAVIKNVRLDISRGAHTSLAALADTAAFEIDPACLPPCRMCRVADVHGGFLRGMKHLLRNPRRWGLPVNRIDEVGGRKQDFLEEQADALEHLAEVTAEKARSGGVRARVMYANQGHRSLVAATKSERYGLRLYRLVGFAQSIWRAAAGWAVVVAGAALVCGWKAGAPMPTKWTNAQWHTAVEYVLELLVSPLSLFRINSTETSSLPVHGPPLYLLRLAITLPFVALVTAIARVCGVRK